MRHRASIQLQDAECKTALVSFPRRWRRAATVSELYRVLGHVQHVLGAVAPTPSPEQAWPGTPASAPVLIGEENPRFAGGSYVIVQKVLARFARLECAAGRCAGKRDQPYQTVQHFSTPVTGTLFFVPSADLLGHPRDPPGPGTAARRPETKTPEASLIQAPSGGSPGICG